MIRISGKTTPFLDVSGLFLLVKLRDQRLSAQEGLLAPWGLRTPSSHPPLVHSGSLLPLISRTNRKGSRGGEARRVLQMDSSTPLTAVCVCVEGGFPLLWLVLLQVEQVTQSLE